MSNLDDPKSDHQHVEPTRTEPTAPPVADVENQANSATAPPTSGFGFGGAAAIVQRWRREDLIKKAALALRVLALIFSLLAFLIMASNKHGDWKNFDRYDEYRYLLAIAILSTLYSLAQALRHVHELSTGRHLIQVQQRTSGLFDFFGDQIMAYLLISASSAAIPLTNNMREGVDNIFTDSSAAAISMGFFAFVSLALLAMISGYKISTQSYI